MGAKCGLYIGTSHLIAELFRVSDHPVGLIQTATKTNEFQKDQEIYSCLNHDLIRLNPLDFTPILTR